MVQAGDGKKIYSVHLFFTENDSIDDQQKLSIPLRSKNLNSKIINMVGYY